MTILLPYAGPRRGYLFLEVLVSMGILMASLLIVTEVAMWSMGQRKQALARQDALELATNILEAARALPSHQLDQQWADKQQLPESLAEKLFMPQLKVTVEPDKSHAGIKKVSVEINWRITKTTPARPVRLVALLGTRVGAAAQ